MRGSREPDDPTDEMCPHCGLYYSNRGIKSHERNCDREEPILPTDRHDEDTPEAPTPSDGDGAGVDPEGSTEEIEADGGTAGLGLDGPPDPGPRQDPADGTDETTDEPDTETVDCPTCGADTGLTPDEHNDGSVYENDCGHRYRWNDE